MPRDAKSAIPTPSPEVTFFPFDEGGVLYLRGSRRIWALNAASAHTWCLLYEVASLDELTSRLSSTFQIGMDKARQDAGSLLDIFDREGLFSEKPYADNMESDPRWDISPTGPRLVEPGHWPVRQLFRIAGRHFEFLCQDADLGAVYTRLMDHLATANQAAPDTRLAVASALGKKQRWDLFIDDLGFAAELQPLEVLPHIATLVFVRCCEALEDHLLFHAAVVEKEGIGVMFPGEAGSGKTSLVAALLTQGYRFYSDELAVFNLENHHVSPLPLPMSIKGGSVQSLERYYSGLAALTVHSRSDGKKVRYLSPPRLTPPAGADESAPVDHVIFPKYIQGAQDRLVSIDKFEALRRLAATGSSNRVFAERDIEAMIALVQGRPCCEIIFSDLDRAVSLVNKYLWSHTKGPPPQMPHQ